MPVLSACLGRQSKGLLRTNGSEESHHALAEQTTLGGLGLLGARMTAPVLLNDRAGPQPQPRFQRRFLLGTQGRNLLEALIACFVKRHFLRLADPVDAAQ